MSQAQCWHWDTQVDQASRCSSRCWGPRSPKPLRVPRQPQDVTMWLVVTSSERQVHGAKAGGGQPGCDSRLHSWHFGELLWMSDYHIVGPQSSSVSEVYTRRTGDSFPRGSQGGMRLSRCQRQWGCGRPWVGCISWGDNEWNQNKMKILRGSTKKLSA